MLINAATILRGESIDLAYFVGHRGRKSPLPEYYTERTGSYYDNSFDLFEIDYFSSVFY